MLGPFTERRSQSLWYRQLRGPLSLASSQVFFLVSGAASSCPSSPSRFMTVSGTFPRPCFKLSSALLPFFPSFPTLGDTSVVPNRPSQQLLLEVFSHDRDFHERSKLCISLRCFLPLCWPSLSFFVSPRPHFRVFFY